MNHSTIEHEAEVARRFDALQTRFKPTLADTDYRLTAIEHILGQVRGLAILDLGCGKGRFSRRLEEQGARVVGLDVSREMLKQGAKFDRIQASSARLPLAAQSIDAVIAVEVFQHVHSIDSTLREIHRVLKPKGRIVIVDKHALALNVDRPWLPNLLIKRVDERRGRGMHRISTAVKERWFGSKALRRSLDQAGFVNSTSVGLLAPNEAAWSVFRRFEWPRAMRLWSAQSSGDSTCRQV